MNVSLAGLLRATAVAVMLPVLLLSGSGMSAAATANSLVGVLTEVPAPSKWKGSQVTFTGLATSEPSIIWPDGFDSQLGKIFEDESLLVLQFVSVAGSTNTVYIEKKNRRFVLIDVSAMAVPIGKPAGVGVYRGVIK